MVITTFQDLSPENKIKKGKIMLKKESPFFGHLVYHLAPVETDAVPTAGVTEDSKLFYNPDFIDSLTKEELKGVLVHEVMHKAMGTFERMDDMDESIANQAHDLVINHIIVNKNGFTIPNSSENFEHTLQDTDNVPKQYRDMIEEQKEQMQEQENFVLLPGEDGDYIDSEEDIEIYDIGEKSFEEVYSIIYEQTDGDSFGGNNQDALLSEDENGDIEVQIGGDSYNIDGDDVPFDIDSEKSDGENNGEDNGKDWDKIVSQATEESSDMKGDIPGTAESIIESREDNSIDYKKYISRTISSIIPNDFSFNRRSDKGRSIGKHLPGVKKEDKADVIMGIDTSGSVSEDMLAKFTGELQGICQTYSSIDLTVIQHDSEIQDVEEYDNAKPSEFENLNVKGRGGTDHTPVFDEIENEYINRTTFVIFLTDGRTSVPDETSLRDGQILWVLDNNVVGIDRLKHGKIARMNL